MRIALSGKCSHCIAWLRALAFSALAGCGGFGFDISEMIPEQNIQGSPDAHKVGPLGGGAPLKPIELNVDLSAYRAKHGNAPVNHVYLKSLVFNITPTANPSDPGCFDFVDSVTIKIASSRPDTSLPNAVIAEAEAPGCVETFVLTPHTDVDLKPYLDEGATVMASGRVVPPEHNTSFAGTTVLRANAL